MMRGRLAAAAAVASAAAAAIVAVSAVPSPLVGNVTIIGGAMAMAPQSPTQDLVVLSRSSTAVGWRRSGDVFQPYEKWTRMCAPDAPSVEVFSRPASCPCLVYYAFEVSSTEVDSLMMTEASYQSWQSDAYAGVPDYLPAYSQRGVTPAVNQADVMVLDTFLNTTGDYRLVVVRSSRLGTPSEATCIGEGEMIFEPIPTPCPVLTVEDPRLSSAGGKGGTQDDRGHRIVGGRDVTSSQEQALIVAMFHDYMRDPFCGGSLIVDGARLAVLTAAHCLVRPPDFVSVGGRTPLSGHRFRVKGEVVPHPDYDGVTLRNDLGLLFLTASPEQAAALAGTGALLNTDASGAPIAGSAVSVIGFGALREYFFANPTVHTLRKVDLPVHSTDDCNWAFGHPNAVENRTQLCAGGQQGCDSCQGTSRGAGALGILVIHGREGVRGARGRDQEPWFFGRPPCTRKVRLRGRRGRVGLHSRNGSGTDLSILL